MVSILFLTSQVTEKEVSILETNRLMVASDVGLPKKQIS